MVVQWKLPSNLSSFVQRAGHAARARGRTGLAVLLVEPTAFSAKAHKDAKTNSDKKDLMDFITGSKCRHQVLADCYSCNLSGTCFAFTHLHSIHINLIFHSFLQLQVPQ
jgi:hypothetical protein